MDEVNVDTNILNQNPPAISPTTKGFVGKFYAESPFLPFTTSPTTSSNNNNNINNSFQQQDVQNNMMINDNFGQQQEMSGFNFPQDSMNTNFNNFGMSYNNYYDPNFMYMNPEQFMMQQQLFFNQHMDDLKHKANIEKDKYLEQAYLTGLCYERCVSQYYLNPLDEYDRFKTMEKTTEHLAPKEADCLKDCIYRQKHFISTVMKHIYTKMSSTNQ